MNKELKVFLITSLSIIVLGGIYIVYHFQFKEFEAADKIGNQTVESPSDTTQPDESELLIEGEAPKGDKKNGQPSEGASDTNSGNAEDERGTDRSSSTGTNGGTTTSGSNTTEDGTGATGSNSSSNSQPNDGKQSSSGNQTTSTGDTTSDKSVTGKTDKKQSVAQIKSKYQPTVNNLQSEVDGELNSLINSAKKEYSTKIANGESVDYGYFYNKYMSSIAGLEAQTDAEFNGIMSSLERDLQANGHNKSSSQSMRDEYEAQKNARRNSMQSEIMGN
ncbi:MULTISPECIES: hypothetical protein [unclassified Sporosarcina]|uniref:hypothetical protein n=1 Tax=unclassified Sporosarcina TaxID=2647733 RepID=UPI000C16B8B7|nr:MULTISPECIES: hypothetical protein [unclassified Sporosarcina]PID05909.1 hypothetical protein CSV66_07930 [Sporosarcina sp. P30]PID09103.1 hypothetical protein CSV65_07930 [Sporosarcina sp. P31]PID12400.1 hypothetical protein CSV64_07400 [Sporosarcina sp. P32b]